MIRRSIVAFALVAGVSHTTDAASLSMSITVPGPASTSITCTAPGASAGATSFSLPYQSPVGTVVCTLATQPAAWQGIYSLTQSAGPTANAFGLSGANIVVAAVPAPGSYSISVVAQP